MSKHQKQTTDLSAAEKKAPEVEKVTMWIDPEGRKVNEESLASLIKDYRQKDPFATVELIVGTDSQMNKRSFKFITVVCLLRKGKGGYYWYKLDHHNRLTYKGNQKLRMFQEVDKSIEVASWLTSVSTLTPSIHIDASPKEKAEFTSAFSDELKGYVTASGFECMLKPEAFVASVVADKHSRK